MLRFLDTLRSLLRPMVLVLLQSDCLYEFEVWRVDICRCEISIVFTVYARRIIHS